MLKLKPIYLRNGSVFLRDKRYLSQLGTTFNQKPTTFNSNQNNSFKESFNSSLNIFNPFNINKIKLESSVGLFGNRDLKSYEGFYYLKDEAESRVNSLIDEASESSKTKYKNKRKLVEIFDDISNELCRVADLAEFVRTAHPEMHFRQAANLAFSSISQIVEKLNTNHELYQKLKQSLEQDSNESLDECDRRVCKLFLVDFEQSGIHLDSSYRDKFVAINDQLVNILMKFQIQSQQASELNVKDLNPKYKSIVARVFRGDPIQVDSMYINSDEELLREFVYTSYLKENKLQESYFRDILNKRKQLANLCGYESYSHRANLNTMLETPENIMDFLKECSKSVSNNAEKEFFLMREFKRKQMRSDAPLMPWDVPLISNRLKKQMFDLDRSQYMAYFSLGACMEGLNLILKNLYK
jgi:intermediate peptidase